MSNEKIGWVAVLAVALSVTALAMARCRGGAEPATGDAPLVLRSYSVPPEYGAELTSIINRLLKMHDNAPRTGRASLGPGGQLVVAAPQGVQQGVEELLESLETSRPAPPPTVSLSYWAVVGRPSSEVEVSSRLGEVARALEAIASAEGTMSFSLLEKLRVQSLSGQHARTMGPQLWVDQTATARGETVLADVDIKHERGPGRLSTRVQLRPGQLLVLGQSGYGVSGDEESGPEAGTQASIYYLVRAQIESSQGQ